MLANNLMEVSAEQGVGGLNLQPARDLGPRVPFVRKISELNRESPLMKSTSPSIAPNADRVHDVAKLNRFESLRSVLSRPTGGGGGFKSLAHGGAVTAQGLTHRFFAAQTFEKISGIKQSNGDRSTMGVGDSIFGTLGTDRHARISAKYFFPTAAARLRPGAAFKKSPRNSGWGGVVGGLARK